MKKLNVLMMLMIGCFLVACGHEHEWREATYEAAKMCDVCGATEGESLEKEAKAYCEAGRTALYGIEGTEINLETAYNNFVKAKEMGMVDANFYLGLLCDVYGYPEKNDDKTKEYYALCSENVYVQIENGMSEENEDEARITFEALVAQGVMEAYVGLGDIAYNNSDYNRQWNVIKKRY